MFTNVHGSVVKTITKVIKNNTVSLSLDEISDFIVPSSTILYNVNSTFKERVG